MFEVKDEPSSSAPRWKRGRTPRDPYHSATNLYTQLRQDLLQTLFYFIQNKLNIDRLAFNA